MLCVPCVSWCVGVLCLCARALCLEENGCNTVPIRSNPGSKRILRQVRMRTFLVAFTLHIYIALFSCVRVVCTTPSEVELFGVKCFVPLMRNPFDALRCYSPQEKGPVVEIEIICPAGTPSGAIDTFATTWNHGVLQQQQDTHLATQTAFWQSSVEHNQTVFTLYLQMKIPAEENLPPVPRVPADIRRPDVYGTDILVGTGDSDLALVARIACRVRRSAFAYYLTIDDLYAPAQPLLTLMHDDTFEVRCLRAGAMQPLRLNLTVGCTTKTVHSLLLSIAETSAVIARMHGQGGSVNSFVIPPWNRLGTLKIQWLDENETAVHAHEHKLLRHIPSEAMHTAGPRDCEDLTCAIKETQQMFQVRVADFHHEYAEAAPFLGMVIEVNRELGIEGCSGMTVIDVGIIEPVACGREELEMDLGRRTEMDSSCICALISSRCTDLSSVQVYGFEPYPETPNKGVRVPLEYSTSPSFVLEKLAVGDIDNVTVGLHDHPPFYRFDSFSEKKVLMRTLDAMDHDGWFRGRPRGTLEVDFLKLDAEGAEPEIFFGAQALLSRHAFKVIHFECSPVRLQVCPDFGPCICLQICIQVAQRPHLSADVAWGRPKILEYFGEGHGETRCAWVRRLHDWFDWHCVAERTLLVRPAPMYIPAPEPFLHLCMLHRSADYEPSVPNTKDRRWAIGGTNYNGVRNCLAVSSKWTGAEKYLANVHAMLRGHSDWSAGSWVRSSAHACT